MRPVRSVLVFEQRGDVQCCTLFLRAGVPCAWGSMRQATASASSPATPSIATASTPGCSSTSRVPRAAPVWGDGGRKGLQCEGREGPPRGTCAKREMWKDHCLRAGVGIINVHGEKWEGVEGVGDGMNEVMTAIAVFLNDRSHSR